MLPHEIITSLCSGPPHSACFHATTLCAPHASSALTGLNLVSRTPLPNLGLCQPPLILAGTLYPRCMEQDTVPGRFP